MDTDEFRRRGQKMIEFICGYFETIRSRRPFPDVKPGYIRELIPDRAPVKGERWEDVFGDIERVIMPGVVHWQHPNFHAYLPATNSFTSTLADLLSESLGNLGLSWASSPVCTELEMAMMDWLCKMLKLPEVFMTCTGSTGGGVIQYAQLQSYLNALRIPNRKCWMNDLSSASEATLVALLSARTRTTKQFKSKNPGSDDLSIMGKCVAYCSDQAHICVDQACVIAGVRLRRLATDKDESLTAQTLQDAVDEDRDQGYIPIFVFATLGSTASCSIDDIKGLGAVCEKDNIWMHIDAAYAGNACICPEYRPLLNGIECAESFNFNASKMLQVNFECSVMWVRNSNLIHDGLNMTSTLFEHDDEWQIPVYRQWQIPHARRFRSLKLWFVLRMYGQEGLQECVRKRARLASQFEQLVKADDRFEIFGKVVIGLVCFRLKQSNVVNDHLLKAINSDGRIYIVSSVVKGVYFLRFVVCTDRTTTDDVTSAWQVIQDVTNTQMKLEEK